MFQTAKFQRIHLELGALKNVLTTRVPSVVEVNIWRHVYFD